MVSVALPPPAWIAAINDALNQKFPASEKIEYVLSHQGLPYLDLDSRAFLHAGINEEAAEIAVRDALAPALATLPSATPPIRAVNASTPQRWPAPPTLAHAYTRLQLARGDLFFHDLGDAVGGDFRHAGRVGLAE